MSDLGPKALPEGIVRAMAKLGATVGPEEPVRERRLRMDEDEAIANEALRLWAEGDISGDDCIEVAKIAVRLTRDGWKPPPPEVLAFREWASRRYVGQSYPITKGEWDQCDSASAFAAGVKWSSDRGRKHISTLVDALDRYGDWEGYEHEIEEVLAPFKETEQ